MRSRPRIPECPHDHLPFCSLIREAATSVLDKCSSAIHKASFEPILLPLVRYAMKWLKWSSLSILQTDKDGGFCIVDSVKFNEFKLKQLRPSQNLPVAFGNSKSIELAARYREAATSLSSAVDDPYLYQELMRDFYLSDRSIAAKLIFYF